MQSVMRSGAVFACATCCCTPVILMIYGGDCGGHDCEYDVDDDDDCDDGDDCDDDYYYDEVNEIDAIHQASTSATKTCSTFSSKVSTAGWTVPMVPAFPSTSLLTATYVQHLKFKPYFGYLKLASGCSRV